MSLSRTSALLATSILLACGTTTPVSKCGDQPCPPGYSVALTTAIPGDYVVELTFGGVMSTVTCPVTAGASGGCTTSDARVVGTFDATGMVVELTPSPQAITLVVMRDGATVLTKTSSPTYTPTYPDGEQCDPLCAVADETYVIP